jgi:hypothetical protein
MVMIKDASVQIFQQRQLADAIAAQDAAREKEAAEPQFTVRLTVSYQELTKPPVAGTTQAEYRTVPPGVPVTVGETEWKRLRGLGVVVDAVAAGAQQREREPAAADAAGSQGSST